MRSKSEAKSQKKRIHRKRIKVRGKTVAFAKPTCYPQKLKTQVPGAFRRVFKTDYKLLRSAGLSRRKALEACLQRVVQNQDTHY